MNLTINVNDNNEIRKVRDNDRLRPSLQLTSYFATQKNGKNEEKL